ncbi:MAG: SpvB/TcaC N-terminal domain-containing protein [Steroidobacteraceae bacterium]
MKRKLIRILACVAAIASVTATAAPGRTPGSAAVSPGGAASYSIPLWTPSGIRGLSPNLALIYSSRAGDGLAGIGFTVAFGQSTISRCDQTIAQDGAPQGASLAATDKFCRARSGRRARIAMPISATGRSARSTRAASSRAWAMR